MVNLQSFAGLIVFPLLAWLLCFGKTRLHPAIALKLVILGVGLQFLIAGTFLLRNGNSITLTF